VGTFSWLQGTPYPSYALMSIVGNCDPGTDPEDLLQQDNSQASSPSIRVEVCFPPSQYTIYFSYIALLIVSVYVLVIEPVLRDLCCGRTRSSFAYPSAAKHSRKPEMPYDERSNVSRTTVVSQAPISSLWKRRKHRESIVAGGDKTPAEQAHLLDEAAAGVMDVGIKLRGGRWSLLLMGIKELARLIRDVLSLYVVLLLVDWLYSLS
jgi:hypothetical protein